ncbi:hypothetical protein Tco_0661418 [Tanacetum coccineum]
MTGIHCFNLCLMSTSNLHQMLIIQFLKIVLQFLLLQRVHLPQRIRSFRYKSLVIPQGVEDDFYDIEVAHMDNNPYFDIPIPKPSSEETTLQGNWRDPPRDNLLVSVEVLRYDIKRSKSENKEIVSTGMELVLEQTQQDALILRTASAAVKPCQRYSLKFYLITGSIYTDIPDDFMKAQVNVSRLTADCPILIIVTFLSDQEIQIKNFKNTFQGSIKYEHVGLEVTRSKDGGKINNDDDVRLNLANDLKEISRSQHKSS